MSGTADDPEQAPLSPADALRAEIASQREELTRAAALLEARFARRPAADTAVESAPDTAAREAAEPLEAADERPVEEPVEVIPVDPPGRIEVLPAPGRNLPARRTWVLQPQSLAVGAVVAVVVYLLTRRRR